MAFLARDFPICMVGIDIGGTFTDFVVWREGRLATYKVPSTPQDFSQAVLAGLSALALEGETVVHGSTVATNALLERKGAKTALLTTAGFRDVLEIGRQNRPALYDLFVERPPPLVPRCWRREVQERISAQGEVLVPLKGAEVEPILREWAEQGVEAVAICLLFSFLYPAHEQALARRARRHGFYVSASVEVLPEFREYERTSTTVINAYLGPVVSRYLARLKEGLETRGCGLRIMQSNGGAISPRVAQDRPVQTVLSGPAAGVIGAFEVGRQAGFEHIITFDMGGTSTDVSLCPGQPQITAETELDGLPLRVPVLDIHTVGAGGGSVAWQDAGGALRVGPESAGADPGPACYGRGVLPTVTDAHLVLGRLVPDYFLGGRMPLYPARAEAAIKRLGEGLRLNLRATAEGILRVANANMERAIRVISVERGYDPRQFTLVAFGGAGGMHAIELARALHIPRVLFPPSPGTLSALGLLLAEVVRDYSRTLMRRQGELSEEEIETHLQTLLKRGREDLAAEGFRGEEVRLERFLDLRYLGQSYELTIPYPRPSLEQVITEFHLAHERRYGYARPEAAVEVVTLRVRAVGTLERPQFRSQPLGPAEAREARVGQQTVWFGEWRSVPLYERERLQPGHEVVGPALVVAADATLVLPPQCGGQVDAHGNLVVEVEPLWSQVL